MPLPKNCKELPCFHLRRTLALSAPCDLDQFGDWPSGSTRRSLRNSGGCRGKSATTRPDGARYAGEAVLPKHDGVVLPIELERVAPVPGEARAVPIQRRLNLHAPHRYGARRDVAPKIRLQVGQRSRVPPSSGNENFPAHQEAHQGEVPRPAHARQLKFRPADQKGAVVVEGSLVLFDKTLSAVPCRGLPERQAVDRGSLGGWN